MTDVDVDQIIKQYGIDAIVEEARRRHESRKLMAYSRRYDHSLPFGPDNYGAYDWQIRFHNAGRDNPERMLMLANRNGKTTTGTMETAIHATGLYPEEWWEGRVFDENVLIWCGAISTKAQKEVMQRHLLGDPIGTGTIPGDLITKISYQQVGVSDVVDAIRVRHVCGKESQIVLKTYKQGWRAWQGGEPHVVHLDEEPKEDVEEGGIYSEVQTRTLTKKGVIYCTETPLLGMTELVDHYTNPPTNGIYLQTGGWDDAPHLDETEKIRLAASYKRHEREARTKGVPKLGEGRVYSEVSEDMIVFDMKQFEKGFPFYWPRIAGIDFGMGHPTAIAWLAWDRDNDIVYLYDAYKKSDERLMYHAYSIKGRGEWIPVAWPHDGLHRDPNSGEALYEMYRKHGIKMRPDSARFDDESGGPQSVWVGIEEIQERMVTGRFKVASHLNDWWDEFRTYHVENGLIKKVRDDLMDATRVAMMDLRYAETETRRTKSRRPYTESIASTAL